MIAVDEAIEALTYKLTNKKIDINTSILVSDDKFLAKPKWCLISTDINKDEHYYRYIVPTTDLHGEEIIISHTNLFNLHSSACKHLFSDIKPKIILQNTIKFSPKFATNVVLTPVECITKIKEYKLCDEAIFNYLQIPRYLCKHDMIRINIKKWNKSGIYSVDENVVETLHLIVESVEGSEYENMKSGVNYGYLVDQYCGTVKQGARKMQSFLIPESSLYVGNGKEISVSGINDSHIDMVPPGLDVYYKEIESWTRPFLSNHINALILPIFLITGKQGCGKRKLLTALAKHFGLEYFYKNCSMLRSDSAAAMETVIGNIFTDMKRISPCVLHLENIEALCNDDIGQIDYRTMNHFVNTVLSIKSEYPFVIFCTSSHINKIHSALSKIFLQSLSIEKLDNKLSLPTLEWVFKRDNIVLDESLEEFSSRTSNFAYMDFVQLASCMARLHRKRMSDSAVPLVLPPDESVINSSIADIEEQTEFLISDLRAALDDTNERYSYSIGAPKIPDVSWNDIGGLQSLKDEILSSIFNSSLPNGLQRSGLLLHGPPGTGKTLLAKAVATQCKYNFLSIKGPELLNQYVGQSEENVRDVFAVARSSAPCIVFFDELDSLAPARGNEMSSGGVMGRVVSQLLTEMDGIQKSKGIFILGATNRPDLIDLALLRPGRFDKMLYVGIYRDHETRCSILKALTRKFKFSDDVNLSQIVNQLPSDVDISGADFYGITSNAWLNAARRQILQNKSEEDKLYSTVTVNKEDMMKAFSEYLCVSLKLGD